MSIIRLDIHVDDLPDVLSLFNKIQVWRSKTGASGLYSEITSSAAVAAVLDGTVAGPWNLSGTNLLIARNGADPVTVTFTGTDPLTLSQVLDAINTAISGIASEVPTNTGKIRLTSNTVGTGSSLLISGNAAAILGLSTTKVNGLAAWVALVNPTTEYSFSDLDGDPSYFYKIRYFSSTTLSVSAFSDPKEGVTDSVVGSGSLTRGQVFLADASGRPMVGRNIIAVPTTVALASGYGILPGSDRIIVPTDATGFAELVLTRGQTYRVYFEGTYYNREIIAPDADTFDLLSLLATSPDPLVPTVAPPMPIRSS